MSWRATAAVLLGSVVACTSVQHVRSQPDLVPADERLAILWVTNQHGEVIPVGQPRLAGDSLVGTWVGVGEPVAIPLDPAVAVRRFDGTRTALLGLSITTGTILLLMLESGSGTGDEMGVGMMCSGDMMSDDCM